MRELRVRKFTFTLGVLSFCKAGWRQPTGYLIPREGCSARGRVGIDEVNSADVWDM